MAKWTVFFFLKEVQVAGKASTLQEYSGQSFLDSYQIQQHRDSLRPDGVECSVQPYDSEEMPAPVEMLFQMQHVLLS